MARRRSVPLLVDPRITEGYALAGMLKLVLRGVLIAVLVLAIAGTTLVLRARAAGSDAPTPYTVASAGITLPTGETFTDGGHVNVRTTTGRAVGIHFEAKCTTRTDAECAGARHATAQYIGTSFIPWSALGLPADACVAWVQLSQHNEHYGEGHQAPVCRTEEDPCPTPTPAPSTPASQPTPATPTADPSGPTSPSATAAPSPEPSASTTMPTSTPAPTATSTPSATPTTTPAAPATTPRSATPPAPSSPPASPAVTDRAEPAAAVLAATGATTSLTALAAAALAAVGLALVLIVRRVSRRAR